LTSALPQAESARAAAKARAIFFMGQLLLNVRRPDKPRFKEEA
jgi:hypothetical protein